VADVRAHDLTGPLQRCLCGNGASCSPFVAPGRSPAALDGLLSHTACATLTAAVTVASMKLARRRATEGVTQMARKIFKVLRVIAIVLANIVAIFLVRTIARTQEA